VAAVMTAHVAYPALDPSGLPATLSRTILQQTLRGDLGFPGLVVTDALIMEGVLGGGESAAVVKALGAGCDLLLYPTDLTACIDAIDRAVDDRRLDRNAIGLSLERRKRWSEWANAERRPAKVTDDDVIWAEELADRVVYRIRGDSFAITDKLDIVVVDDDLGGPYPPPSRQPFVETLRAGGLQAGMVDSPSGSRDRGVVVALFGDIRSWKGRPGYSAGALAAVHATLAAASAAAQKAILVQFSHPRLASTIPGDAPMFCAWGGEAVMQRAAARFLTRKRKASVRSEMGAGR